MSRGSTRLIAVNRFYWPDYSATSQLLTNLAERLAADGQSATVITSRQRYDDPLAHLPAREVVGGVRIVRVWTSHFGRHWLPGRAIDYLTFYLSAFWVLLREARPGDTILAKTDPPLLSVPAWLAARVKGAALVTWCQDVFPEIVAALGTKWADSLVGQVLRWLRNHSLRAAACNVVLSEAMAARLHAEGIPPGRVRVIPNWADSAIRPVPHAINPLRRAWGLEGRFVIGYSGNLGRAHAADAVIALVRRTADLEDLTWLFIGGGVGLAKLRAAVEADALENVRFQLYQPRKRLALSMSVAHAHLVSLDPSCEGLVMPSKLYGSLAAGRPIVFLGAASGSVATLLHTQKVGVVLPLERPDTWRDEIVALQQNRAWLAEMGANARLVCESRFRADHALAAWADVLAAAGGGVKNEPARAAI